METCRGTRLARCAVVDGVGEQHPIAYGRADRHLQSGAKSVDAFGELVGDLPEHATVAGAWRRRTGRSPHGRCVDALCQDTGPILAPVRSCAISASSESMAAEHP